MPGGGFEPSTPKWQALTEDTLIKKLSMYMLHKNICIQTIKICIQTKMFEFPPSKLS